MKDSIGVVTVAENASQNYSQLLFNTNISKYMYFRKLK